MQLTTHVTIIGAGLTGLSLAFFLQAKGISVMVVEKRNRAGGVMQTLEKDGFIYESGPNTGIIARGEVAELFKALAPDCTIELANPQSKNRWILKKGKWEPIPAGFFKAIKTPLFTLRDKFGILGEPFRKRGDNPMESIAGMVKRRMGKSYLDYAVDPFISGIYAGDPDQLITKYAMPKLYALEQNYGSFIKGAIKKSREAKTPVELQATKEVFAARGGFKQLVAALLGKLPEQNTYFGASALQINKENKGFTTAFTTADGTNCLIHSDWVVSTVGGHSLKAMFDFIEDKELKPISDLRYAKVVQVVMGFSKWNGPKLNAFGGLIPSKEKRNILGVLFPSSIFGGRAPAGGALLSVFMGGIKKPEIIEMDDAALTDMAKAELEDLLQINRSEMAFLDIFRYPHAIPQYDAASPQRLERIAKLEQQYPGLLLAGNIRNGIGISDRIGQAVDLAELIGNKIKSGQLK
jgi:protoporphyrinogen/coproporphyrinogen III oxidase